MEEKIILTSILRNFNLSPIPDADKSGISALLAELVLRPKFRLHVIIERRLK